MNKPYKLRAEEVEQIHKHLDSIFHTLLAHAMAHGPDAWMSEETPPTLVELRIPRPLSLALEKIAQLEAEARERMNMEKKTGVLAELETAFVTNLILCGIVAEADKALRKLGQDKF